MSQSGMSDTVYFGSVYENSVKPILPSKFILEDLFPISPMVPVHVSLDQEYRYSFENLRNDKAFFLQILEHHFTHWQYSSSIELIDISCLKYCDEEEFTLQVLNAVIEKFCDSKYKIDKIVIPVNFNTDDETRLKDFLKKSKEFSIVKFFYHPIDANPLISNFCKTLLQIEECGCVTHSEILHDAYPLSDRTRFFEELKGLNIDSSKQEFEVIVRKNGRKDRNFFRSCLSRRNVVEESVKLFARSEDYGRKCEIRHNYYIDSRAVDSSESNEDSSNSSDNSLDCVSETYRRKILPKQPIHYWKLESCKYKGSGTIVAIIDSGIDFYHPAFFTKFNHEQLCDHKVVAAVNFCHKKYFYPGDDNGHGTMCAGIVCGSSYTILSKQIESGKIIVPPGVARDAKLVVCKVDSSLDSQVRALTWINQCINPKAPVKIPINVVSFSLKLRAYSLRIEQEISKLVSAGVLVVCASSNDGHQCQQPIRYPAALGNVFCVGSHGAFGKPSEFSPVGQQIDFLAPGEDIMGPSFPEGVKVSSGTSYAAPALAGLICCILQCLREICPKDGSLFKKIQDEFDMPKNLPKEYNVFNHWIVKQLLCQMATNPGIHFSDRGYGSLDPEQFFKNPKDFLTSALKL